MNSLKVFFILISLICSFNSLAATKTQMFKNNFESNSIYLWMNDINEATFSSVQFSDASDDWQAFVNNGSELFMAGNTITANNGRFDVEMEYQTIPFGFEWAEILWTGNTFSILGSGSLFWENRWIATNDFSHLGDIVAPVPIPGSMLLLLSALIGMTFMRRSQHVS